MPLTWDTPQPGLGPTLGYRDDGVQVARIRNVRNAWHGWYDPASLERPTRAPSGQTDDGGHLIGSWGSTGAAIDRYHERHVSARLGP